MQSRLRELRLYFGLDRQAMAALLHYDPAEWQAWESGAVALPPHTRDRLAQRFGVNEAWLDGRSECILGERILHLQGWLRNRIRQLSGPDLVEMITATTGERIAYVILLMQGAAPDLLTLDCAACWLGLSTGSTDLLLKRNLDPGSPVVARAAELTGIPDNWFRLGPVDKFADEQEEGNL